MPESGDPSEATIATTGAPAEAPDSPSSPIQKREEPIFKPMSGPLRSWVIPYGVAKTHPNNPGPGRRNPWFRDLSWAKLNKLPLAAYEDNWALKQSPSDGKQSA
jgi:hypothetical protein